MRKFLPLLLVLACDNGVYSGGLLAEDRALIEEAGTLIFSFSNQAPCADLIDEGPAAIGEALEGAPLQLVDPDDKSYTFGKVPPNESVAYLVLLSSTAKEDLGNRVQFSDLAGSVFGIGCRDFNAASGTRHDLPITVFAAGLR